MLAATVESEAVDVAVAAANESEAYVDAVAAENESEAIVDVTAAATEREAIDAVVAAADESEVVDSVEHVANEDDYLYVDDVDNNDAVHGDHVSVDDDDDDVDGDISGDVKSPEGVHLTAPVQKSIDIDLSDDDDNHFISAYIQSIRRAKDVITAQWKECVWDQKNLNIELPATTHEVWMINTLSCPIKLAMP